MSESHSRLSARPSLEQLHKQARDLLRQYRSGDPGAADRFRACNPRFVSSDHGRPVLADAQFVIARESGFESWARLKHHLESLPALTLEPFRQQASDLLGAIQSDDTDALQRLGDILGRTFSPQELGVYITQRLGALDVFTLDDARRLVARQYGFEDWPALATSLQRPPSDPRSASLGMSTLPPFYRIDWASDRLEVRGPLSDGNWDTIVAVMREHEISGLAVDGQMTDAMLARLHPLEFVTSLQIGGSRAVTDDGLRYLERMPQLEELDLSGWHSQVTDRGLEALRHLKALRKFQMCWSQRISDAGVANLAFCDRLESVNLLGTPTGDGAIRALAGKPNLRRFSSGKGVTDDGISLLHRLPSFKVWQGGEPEYGLMTFEPGPTSLLLDGVFTGRGLAALRGLDGVFGLSFFWHTTALTTAALMPLADLPNLGFLGCQGELCDDEAMRYIAAIPRLRMLMGQGTVATDEGFTALSRSQTIEYIWGRECPNLGGRGFTALAAMPALKGLAVSCRNVGDAALSALPSFPSLRALMPMDVSDDGFRHVGRCAQLEELTCMYCRETGDVATGHLAGLSTLKSYYAGATQITDVSLEILGRMTTLERISLWNTAGVTNAGMAALSALPRLRELNLDGLANVTREGAAVFPARVRLSYSP